MHTIYYNTFEASRQQFAVLCSAFCSLGLVDPCSVAVGIQGNRYCHQDRIVFISNPSLSSYADTPAQARPSLLRLAESPAPRDAHGLYSRKFDLSGNGP